MDIFAAQQSAEKAVNLYNALNQEIWSRSISIMLSQLTEFKVDDHIIEKSKELDGIYIGSMYPDYNTNDSPSKYYSIEDANRCINYAKEIFEFCSKNIRT